jgi:hypothetical protein
MSSMRSLANRSAPSGRVLDDSSRYVGDLENARETESSLRDSVRLYNSPYHAGENHNLSEAAHEPKFFFMCGRCDMLVGEADRVCQFCGAEFIEQDQEEDGPKSPSPPGPDEEAGPEGDSVRPSSSRDLHPCRQQSAASRVDVLSMLTDGRSRLGVEHLAGGSSFAFANYARVLRRIENIINEANDFGAETEEARRMLLAAWKACHEGKWNRALHLADESRKILAPGVTHLVQGQISCLREAIIEMKRRGRIVTPLVIEIKTIQRALDDLKIDDAIKLTKELIAEIKQAQMHLLDNMDFVSDPGQDAYCGQGI